MSIRVSRMPASVIGPVSNLAQTSLNLQIDCETEVQGVGMGVLSDGTPFLTQRGLAVLCGVENAHIGTISSQWHEPIPKPRVNKVRDILSSRGERVIDPHYEIKQAGRVLYAYPENMCLAILEYYAFEAGAFCQDEARSNFRRLAGIAFRKFVYEKTGYKPTADLWKPFHDRVSLVYHSAPEGYFSIFKETAEVFVTLGQAGIHPDDQIIPDISIGRCWSLYWSEQSLEATYGRRLEYKHYYPAYFPQALSNPQTPWCYPELALGAFKKWLREEYIRGGKFQSYLTGQVGKRQISSEIAEKALEAYRLPTGSLPKKQIAIGKR